MNSSRSVVILAGGASRRMGTDKAFLDIGGRTILRRMLEEATAGFTDSVLVVNDGSAFERALERYGWMRAQGDSFTLGARRLRLLTDRRPGLGPLAGLEVALGSVSGRRAWALGCDLPFMTPEAGRRLLEALRPLEGTGKTAGPPPAPAAAVPRLRGRLQPTCAAFEVGAGEVAATCLDEGEHRVSEFLKRLRLRVVDEAEFRDLGDPARLFLNVNDPADLERARALA